MKCLILVIVALLRTVSADVDNFPVKSINVAAADEVEFYVAPVLEESVIEDPHPVHGIETSDGSFVLVGKGGDQGNTMEAFAIKLSASGSVQWTWTSGLTGNDVANSVVQIGNNDDLIIVGFATVGGVAKRAMWRLSSDLGQPTWFASTFGDEAGSNGAWEVVAMNADSTGLLIGGVHRMPSSEEMAFKSYGNVPSGKSVVMNILLTALASAPTSSSAAWTASNFNSAYLTVKAVHPISIPGNKNVVALLWGEEKHASLVELGGSTGAVVSGPHDYGVEHGEGTDMVALPDGFAISGQGKDGSVGLSGRITRVGSNYSRLWTKSYSAGGDPKYILNECWGLQAMADGGFALACGTGIENCNGMTGTMLSQCRAGQPLSADDRPGAIPRKAGVWQSLVVRTDTAGELLWQRVDQFRNAGEPPLGTSGWEEHSSASEYVLKCANGDLASVNDEVSGIGLLRFRSSAVKKNSSTTNIVSKKTTDARTTKSEDRQASASARTAISTDGLLVCMILMLAQAE
eukprot:TRINITY_DN13285_c0_g1_i3.p1 TRINITY_DN13285_c0_g1~~TRINITY_DN13285_c0_g1_i3.p1  ORF type:complete len:517 (+),score=61.30 TRINITY_DN13285_c0_g1_i3:67-1617(+)